MDLLNQSSELSEQLKAKLVQAESERTRSREELKQAQAQLSQYNQLLASLKSSHQAKLETVQEFKQELQEFGVHADEGAIERAQRRRDELQERLHTSRSRKSEYERTITSTELEMKALVKRMKKVEKDYQDLRTFVVNAKAVGAQSCVLRAKMMLNVVCTSVSWLTCRLMNCVQCRINPWARYVSRSLTMKICVMHCVSRKITHA